LILSVINRTRRLCYRRRSAVYFSYPAST